ncbi:formylglycine-generating enzyme family protein [Prochlorothrix hollandica]|uniref:formylglycine-generating enzyme family protein n=1 Tax=Prochlorothrix hollandica TaxID=1223 RepID=UPI00037940CA|nr:formylglycine-generating enzyme family protein [Prochlorothrix hollandica]
MLESVLAKVVLDVGGIVLANVAKGAIGGFVEGLVEQAFGSGQALRQDRDMALALRDNQGVLASFAEAQGNLAQVQDQQNHLKRKELQLAAQQGALSLAITERLGEANLELGWRQLEQQGQIAAQTLQQQRELARQEQDLQVWLQTQTWTLQQQHHQDLIQVRQQEQQVQIQANWDQQKLGLILSRQELERLDGDRPLFLSAKVEAAPSCPAYFQTELAGEAASQMRLFTSKVFGAGVQFYSGFFDASEVTETTALQLRTIIPHIPTIMAFPQVQRRRGYLHYVLWGSDSAAMLPNGQFNLDFDWKLMADRLRQAMAERSDLGSPEEQEEQVEELLGDWIIALQQVCACYLVDLYGLVDGLNPFMGLSLDRLDLGHLEPLVWTYRQPLREQLRRLQKARIAAFEALLREEAERQAALEAERERAERERRRQAAARERLRREAEERNRPLDPSQPVILSLKSATRDQRVPLELLSIPGGTFWMGQTEAETQQLKQKFGEEEYQTYFTRELPRHRVTVPPFWMGRYPVTQGQYEAVMGSNPATRYNADQFVAAHKPVVGVTWYEAVAFCQKLTALCRGELKGGEILLPTEAQWEYACRAGTETAFHFGDRLNSDQANFNGTYTYNGFKTGEFRQVTTPVGSFPANGWGLQDMHGNVWEWCLDHWHDSYNDKPEALKQNGCISWVTYREQASRLLRGGSWDYNPGNCRSAFRSYYDPGVRFNLNNGFRVVCCGPRTP